MYSDYAISEYICDMCFAKHQVKHINRANPILFKVNADNWKCGFELNYFCSNMFSQEWYDNKYKLFCPKCCDTLEKLVAFK